MQTIDPYQTPARRRILITAYHYDGAYSMESRLSWQRAQHAARDYDVTVICARGEQARVTNDSRSSADQPAALPVEVALLPLSRWERRLMSLSATYYFGYRGWHRRVFELARRIHAQRPFDLVHHVSFCGYREPSYGWKLGAPFVWGPVGGTQPFPWRFLGQVDPVAAVREVARNCINRIQLRYARRVHRAAKAAAKVLAANREVAHSLETSFKVAPTVQLETGVSAVHKSPRPRREVGQPLRILWSGRLRPWKGLPLLLRALVAMPAEARYTLRVLGQGPSRQRWQRLAERLGIADRVEWAGWPEYPEQLAHYEWADVFAFTSLRDTSGTGLLEALAAGAPIIGLDHQGAADVMTERCALRVDAASPASAIEGFRTALTRITADNELLQSLSRGAIERADDFHWDRQWELFREIYARATESPTATASLAPPSSTRRHQRPLVLSGVSQ